MSPSHPSQHTTLHPDAEGIPTSSATMGAYAKKPLRILPSREVLHYTGPNTRQDIQAATKPSPKTIHYSPDGTGRDTYIMYE